MASALFSFCAEISLNFSMPVDSTSVNTVSVRVRRASSSICSSHPPTVCSKSFPVSVSSAASKRFRCTCQENPSCWAMPLAALFTTMGMLLLVISMPITEVSGTMRVTLGRI